MNRPPLIVAPSIAGFGPAPHAPLFESQDPSQDQFPDEFPDASPIGPERLWSTVEEVAGRLAATAIERDRRGGHAAEERALLRASGLLLLSIPKEHGGPGWDWTTVLLVVRRLAEVDSALAHLFGFHHLQIAGVLLYGTAAQQQHYLRTTREQGLFWGNALNPLDRRTVAHPEGDGSYRLDGQKSYCSGSVGSDILTISAWHRASETALIGAVPTRRAGIEVLPDWDAFGQRQTDSGSVSFSGVKLEADEVLQAPGIAASPRATLRSQVAQLVMTNLYLGIAQGAFAEARRYSRDEARAWPASGVERSVDEPFIQQRYGEWWLRIRPAAALADEAGRRLDEAVNKGDTVTAAERGIVALAGAEAKVLAHRASIEVTNALFEATGARSTAARYGFDRFWRNARVHTLHDPIDYKIRDIGRHQLTGQLPDPTPYS